MKGMYGFVFPLFLKMLWRGSVLYFSFGSLTNSAPTYTTARSFISTCYVHVYHSDNLETKLVSIEIGKNRRHTSNMFGLSVI